MLKGLKAILILLTALFSSGCKEPFDHAAISDATEYLIVEGNINPAGSSNISISRTLKLSDNVSLKNELKAIVQVEGESSGVFPLPEKGNGLYSVSQLNLSGTQKYRLRIKTSGGKEYLSDFVPVMITPAIDNINWVRDEKGVKIFANAHDSKTQSRYYKWDYDETWEMQSREYAEYEYIIPTISIRKRATKEADEMFLCWRTQGSNTVIIGSTAKLEENVIHEQRLLDIPDKTEKLAVKYSILVRQYAITREAYEYLSIMKKNTEQSGSLFDQQPSELKGNIRSTTNPGEQVIGFFQVASVSEKRIFITRSEVPGWDFLMACQYIEVPLFPGNLVDAFGLGNYIPVSPFIRESKDFWMGVAKICADCRLRGGNNTKPAFW